MRQKGKVVAREFLSNCVLGSTLAAVLACLVKPEPGSKATLLAVIVASGLASGAIHGLAAFVLGRVLYGKNVGMLDFPSTDEPLPRRVVAFFLGAFFTSLRSAIGWGLPTSFVTAFAFGGVVDTVARSIAPEYPWWLAPLGAAAGWATGRLALWMVRRTAGQQTDRSKKAVWLLLSLQLWRVSNWRLLQEARRSQLAQVSPSLP